MKTLTDGLAKELIRKLRHGYVQAPDIGVDLNATDSVMHKAADYIETLPTGAQQAWMPIESAPKDYVTEFDGWNGERVTNVSWAHPDYSAKGHFAWCVSERDCQGQINVEVRGLTHWMPLPDAPA